MIVNNIEVAVARLAPDYQVIVQAADYRGGLDGFTILTDGCGQVVDFANRLEDLTGLRYDKNTAAASGCCLVYS